MREQEKRHDEAMKWMRVMPSTRDQKARYFMYTGSGSIVAFNSSNLQEPTVARDCVDKGLYVWKVLVRSAQWIWSQLGFCCVRCRCKKSQLMGFAPVRKVVNQLFGVTLGPAPQPLASVASAWS
jgi:hypothetical protein